MGCIGSKTSLKKDKDVDTPFTTGHETPTKQLSLRKQLSQKREATITKDPSLLKKDPSQGELKSERSKDETSVDKEVVEVTREDVNIIINENFDLNDAQDTRTTSEKERELPRTPTPSPSPSLRKRPTPSPSPSLRKSPAFQMRGRRLSEGNTTGKGSSFRKMINQALNRHSMSQSLDVTSVAPLQLSSQISEDKEEEPLTKEVMLEWKTPNVGFERLLATKAGLKLFDNFLRKEFSSENLQFWIACEKLKSITEEKKFNDHVDVIFKIYIDPSALDEISLEGRVKSSLRKKKLNPTRDIFEEAQTKIYSLMHRDSFPRFLISKDYKDALLQFGPLTPDSPSFEAEEPKFPRSSELEGELVQATKSLLENLQTPETDERFDTDLQQGEMEKRKSRG